jgi:phage-related protein
VAVHHPVKLLYWVGSSLRDLRGFPRLVRRVMGQALDDAQHGEKHPGARPLKGFGGAGVLEVIEDDDGDTYRTVYTVKLASAVYVLHAFQKKSKRGRATPKKEIDLIKRRLREAQLHHRDRSKRVKK